MILAASCYAELPDTVKIMWQHSSMGARVLETTSGDLKSRIDSLGDAYDRQIWMWDYRTNTNPEDAWAGWRTARFDSADNESGWMHPQKDIYNFSANNMKISHLTDFWEDHSMTKDSVKGGFLLVDTVVDVTPEPDTTIDITDFDIVWFLPAYWHYYDIHADSLASYRAQALRWRDSAVVYGSIRFVYIHQVPLKYNTTEGGYMDATDDANCFAFDAFWRDTLQDLDSVPNFFTRSFYQTLVETDSEDDRYACVKEIYEGTDNHSNMAACIVLQDSIVTKWLPDILDNWGATGATKLTGSAIKGVTF